MVRNSPVKYVDVRGFSPFKPGGGKRVGGQSCAQKRRAQKIKVDRLIDSGSGSSPDCSGEPGCTKITFIVKLGDPCAGVIDKKVGHTGVGIGNDYYDYGPSNGNHSPGEPWWDNPDSNGTLGDYWKNHPGAPTSTDDIDLDDVVAGIRKGDIGHGKQVVQVEYCACNETTKRMRNYWEDLYDQLQDGDPATTPIWEIPGLQCTSAACQGLTGHGGFGTLSPERFLFGRLKKLKNECGGNKGGKAHFSRISP